MRGPARGLSSSPVVKRNIFLVQGLQEGGATGYTCLGSNMAAALHTEHLSRASLQRGRQGCLLLHVCCTKTPHSLP